MLLKIDDLHLSYGRHVLADGINISVGSGDRLCLVGRNGAGKSSLLKCLAGINEIDSGLLWRRDGAKLGFLPQDLPEPEDIAVFDYIAQGLDQIGKDLSLYHELAHKSDSQSLAQLELVQTRIESADGWNFQSRIARIISRLELDDQSRLHSLSGGQRRRAALGRSLVSDPDILLLDEPTNHLDISSIEWLEQELKNFAGAVLFITHDRAFLERVANKIGELDRGHYREFEGCYSAYLAFREKKLEEEERHNAEFDKHLGQEEAWIRQGIKARRTRDEGRVRALEKLREERKARREQQGTAKLVTIDSKTSGKLVAELTDVSFYWHKSKPIISHFSGRVMRGDKIGLIGPNGIGKTTFLKTLLGTLQPTDGNVRLGTRLDIGFFDQLREQLNLDASAVDNVAGGREFIDLNGQSRHALSYLSDFLFSPDRARLPVKALSGGERNRILLAKLFSHSSNLLVLDEPTNDLDMETLELLEERLINYSGTVLLVSHDRQFIDNVVTSTLSFEGGGVIKEYVGGYQDWIRQGGIWFKPNVEPEKSLNLDDKLSDGTVSVPTRNKSANGKLSYKLKRELDELPERIEELEVCIEGLQEEMNQPNFYQQEQQKVKETMQALEEKHRHLQEVYDRWEELESMQAAE